MQNNETVGVCVVYALPDRQVLVDLELPRGATVVDAVARSAMVERFPEIVTRPLSCAVYGRVVALDRSVEEGDRIEILRPLLIDPKVKRRENAQRNRARLR